MPLTIQFDVEDGASPVLDFLRRGLEDPTELHGAIAERAEVLTRDYLRGIAPIRHGSAWRLGARPTGILEKAAESPEGRGGRDFATLTMRPGEVLARAFGDVVITPRGKYLTIPVAAEAYGRRAREFGDLFFLLMGPKRTPVLARRAANGNMTVYYLLVTKVTQKQDRTLLPSDDAYLAAMEAGAEDVLLAGERDGKEGLS